MITDPNYTLPPHIGNPWWDSLEKEYREMVCRELSGCDGEIPSSIVEQVTGEIEWESEMQGTES